MKKLLFMLSLTLISTGCSTTPSVPVPMQLPPPAACLAECSALPAYTGNTHGWMLDAVDVYTECAVLQAQCKSDLVGRSKDNK